MALLSQHGADVRPSMFGRASALIFALLLGAPVATSCSAGAGESAGSCEGGEDSDGDGLFGCSDSDCHRFELCRKVSQLVPDGGDTGGSGGQGGNAGMPPVGGSGGVMVSGGRGGTGGHEDDGGAEHDAGTCACSPGAMCVDGGCVPIEEPKPLYTVQMVSAHSPRGTFGPPPDGVCVEIACRSGGGSPVSYCPCEPELYVRVIHIKHPTQPDPGEEIVLSTQIQGEMLMVTFGPDEKADDVALEPGDKLRFELWDQNMTVADAMIDACEPDLHELTSGPIECFFLSGPTGLEEFWIRGTLEKH